MRYGSATTCGLVNKTFKTSRQLSFIRSARYENSDNRIQNVGPITIETCTESNLKIVLLTIFYKLSSVNIRKDEECPN